MSKPRAVVSEALADRGRPELWATEEESAALSGMSVTNFTIKLPALEQAGFPAQSSWNGKRFIPAIVAFWERETRSPSLKPITDAGEDAERNKEKWNHGRTRETA